MDKQTINIYSDKKFAAIFFVGLFSASAYFTVAIWFDNSSLLIKLLVTLTGLLFVGVSSFGIFSLFSKQFKYYTPGIIEYSKSRSNKQVIFMTFDDRLQARINPLKVVYYKDINSITAIPNGFSYYDMAEDDVLINYIEIRYGADKKIVLTDGYDFIKSFQQNQNTIVRELPTVKDVEEKFGKAKFIAASFLFQASPIRFNLWTKQ